LQFARILALDHYYYYYFSGAGRLPPAPLPSENRRKSVMTQQPVMFLPFIVHLGFLLGQEVK
jgi:hypothetical protein